MSDPWEDAFVAAVQDVQQRTGADITPAEQLRAMYRRPIHPDVPHPDGEGAYEDRYGRKPEWRR